MSQDYIRVNKALWNAKTPIHIASDFYDLDGFLAGKNSLNAIELDLLGDIRGKKVLHLQCHFGQDSLSMARMGAQVTGIDLSDQAIDQAQQLAKRMELEVTFVCCNVFNIDLYLNDTYDLIFTSYGVVGWLPSLGRWGELIARFLKPDGKLVFVEFHPVLWMFNEKFDEIKFSYFNRGPIIEQLESTYADPESDLQLEAHTWNHSLAEVFQALLTNGMTIKDFQEYDYSPYDIFGEGMEKEGAYQVKDLEDKLPLVYSIVATKTG